MKVSLRISPAAAKHIGKMFEAYAEEMAVVITGFVAGTLKTVDGDNPDTPSLAEIAEGGKKLASSLPSKITVEYAIGTKALARLPANDVHTVEGIKCYLPNQIIELVGSREIVLDNGTLRFEPRLEPREIERTKAGTS